MVRAAGIAAGTLFVAIGLAAQFGGADIFGTRSYGHPVAVAPSPKPAPTPSAKPSPPALASPVALSASTNGTIYRTSSFGPGHKKKKG